MQLVILGRALRTAPTPLLEASTSTTNCRLGLGTMRMGAVVNLELGEGLLGLRRPQERSLRRSESMDRRSYCADVSDKLPVEVSKAQKLLELLAVIFNFLRLTLARSICICPGAMMKPRNDTDSA